MRAALGARRGDLRARRARRARARPDRRRAQRQPRDPRRRRQGDARGLRRRRARAPHRTRSAYLDDGELAAVDAGGFRAFTLDNRPARKPTTEIDWGAEDFDRGGHGHFMRKEILEQPEAVEGTLRGRLEPRFATAHLGGVQLSARELLGDPPRVRAGLRLRLLRGPRRRADDRVAGPHPRDAEPASEFRYRDPVDRARHALRRRQPVGRDLRHARRRAGGQAQGRHACSAWSTWSARASRARARAASTCTPGPRSRSPRPRRSRARPWPSRCSRCTSAACATSAPPTARASSPGCEALPGPDPGDPRAGGRDRRARRRAWAEARGAFFIGRVRGYPVALEGAQKLKEVSYVHAEAYPASELKHGPLALVSPELPDRGDRARRPAAREEPLVGRAGPRPRGTRARGRPPAAADERSRTTTIVVPRSEPELDPILLGIPLQLLAYHAAVALGRDVDQPRNLAKSVTVE